MYHKRPPSIPPFWSYLHNPPSLAVRRRFVICLVASAMAFASWGPVADLTSQPENRLIKQLFDFERVHLSPGAVAQVNFTVSQV
jgi:hypothetical protein